ncbi:MAG: alpha-amylase family glycosyl hydrolase [Ignavibacteriales bacterium]|nr:alpha-amylase family glycosyl hydrolase [Ignavibacteriales bacterium]
MITHPKLYEINTRVWINKFSLDKKKISLTEIPDQVWKDLADKGINIVWLMGIWKTNPALTQKYCLEDFLIRNYEKALKDWKLEDVIGSPFAIDEYIVNPDLGDFEILGNLREKLNSFEIKLFLDFIPNHFSAGSNLIKNNPEIFLPADEEMYSKDKYTFFKPEGASQIFAHGRDPFFPAWQDTIQVNYISPEAVAFMIDTLYKIAKYCDGVRCDMAMLALSNVFFNTWRGVLNKLGFSKPDREFWQLAIKRVKEHFPDFIFMAETYWDLEWDLQQLGFDYTYDKKLTDRLNWGNVRDIRNHLMAELDYQNKLVRFIENHDEERAEILFGRNRSKAAAVVMSTIPGIRFYYDGQFEGKKIKLPVQLGREPNEKVNQSVQDFYFKLLRITKEEVFHLGIWKLLTALPAWEHNNTFSNMLAWNWNYKNENRLIVVNYSDQKSQCRLKLDVGDYDENFEIIDLLNDYVYLRSSEEVYHTGLYVELQAFQSHIFAY